ncbi:MAG: chitobiase/beta-hexosaminidase C-terminal domain-containing protein [Prevotella sp.]|nr:chitobiase/beta-hexosaminidase C-terminal domain-containing protein [Prevotella sp.]
MSNPGTGRASKQVLYYNSDKSGNRATLGGTAVTGYMSILNLPKDATITITYDGTISFKSSNLKNSSDEAVAVDDAVVSNETYTVTTAGDVDFYHGTWSGFRKVVISYESNEEIVTAPTLELTGTNGNSRIVTVTNGTSTDGEATVTTYYTTNGNAPTSSSTEVEGGEISVSESCTIKAITISSKGGESTVTELAVEAGTTIVLNSPVLSRTAGTTVSITAPQSVLGTPTATIYYRIGDTGDFAEYTEPITVSATNMVYAYATATGYANSTTSSKEIAFVSSLPQVRTINYQAFTTGGIDTENATDGGTITTYYPMMVDGNQWGSNIYFQNNGWTLRGNNTWLNNGASSANSWMLIKDLKKGDIVVIRIDESALATVNATYVEKYSFNGHYAYSANADGNIELRFQRKANKGNNIFYGIDQYPNTTFTLSSGTANRLTFHNAGSGAANDENWKMNVYNAGNKVGEVRSDWWDNVAADNGNFTYPYVFSADGGITSAVLDWDTFLSDAQDADCDFTVSYTGGTLYIIGTMTKGNDVYYVNYSKGGLSANVSIYLYGKNATLSSISYSATDVNTTWAAPSGIIPITIPLDKEYATFNSDYALDFTDVTAISAYTAVVKNDGKSVTMSKVTGAVPANTGLLIRNTEKNGATTNVPVAASASAVTNEFIAVTAANCDSGEDYKTVTEGYVLGTVAGVQGFYLANSSGTHVGKGKAYLPATGSGARLSIVFDDEETTGISLTPALSEGEGAVYNLNGQRVNASHKGIVIKNGKKLFVK